MGNVISPQQALVSNVRFEVLRASTVDEMQRKIDALVATLIANNQVFVDGTLVGAGDGEAFEFVASIDTSGGVASGVSVVVVGADSASEMVRHLETARAGLPQTDNLVGAAFAGTSKGDRFMGIIVSEPAS